MKVLLVGNGGREHALAWKISQSPLVDVLYAAPGNPGIAQLAKCLPIATDAIDDLGAFAAGEGIDLTVVGPELPLVRGLADRFAARGLTVFGPSARAAVIEGSKAYAKALMARHGVPTARFATFDDPARARRFCRELGAPLVVKADGLAGGKGAVVCESLEAADRAVGDCLERRAFGAAGATVVVEEFLRGEEASFFVVTNGVDAITLAAARDHKTIFDGGRGPNTGGMGAYSPHPEVDEGLCARIMETIVRPTIAALAEEKAPYRGVLFVGLMLTDEGPKVIEFNCRFGDPECQAIVVRATGDLVPLLAAAARGEALGSGPGWSGNAAVCVTLASRGYPGAPVTGGPIEGVQKAAAMTGVQVFHAGTAQKNGRLVTAGGRVLNVTAVGAHIDAAALRAYEAVAQVHFEGMQYRSDIGCPRGARSAALPPSTEPR